MRTSKQHATVRSILTSLEVPFSEEVRFHGLRDQRSLPFDFAILVASSVGLMEIDGEQHFHPSSLFHKTPEDYHLQRQHDAMKVEWCEKFQIPLLKISYLEKGKEYALIVEFMKSILQMSSIRTYNYFSPSPSPSPSASSFVPGGGSQVVTYSNLPLYGATGMQASLSHVVDPPSASQRRNKIKKKANSKHKKIPCTIF